MDCLLTWMVSVAASAPGAPAAGCTGVGCTGTGALCATTANTTRTATAAATFMIEACCVVVCVGKEENCGPMETCTRSEAPLNRL